jgi:hypothetical protein
LGGEIAAKVQECKKEKLGAAKDALMAAGKNMAGCSPYMTDKYCGNETDDPIVELKKDISDLTGSGLTSAEITSLKSGLSKTCGDEVHEGPGAKSADKFVECDGVYDRLEDAVGKYSTTASSLGEGSNSGRGD